MIAVWKEDNCTITVAQAKLIYWLYGTRVNLKNFGYATEKGVTFKLVYRATDKRFSEVS